MTEQMLENEKTATNEDLVLNRYSPYMGSRQSDTRAGEIVEIEKVQIRFGSALSLKLRCPNSTRYGAWECGIVRITQYQGKWILVLSCHDERVESDHMTIMQVMDSKRQLMLFKEEEFPAVVEFVETHVQVAVRNTAHAVASKQNEQAIKSALNIELKTDWYGGPWKSYDDRMKEQEYLKQPKWLRELKEIGTLMITMWFPQN